ncbi:MAG: hypothetical protein QOI42_1884, partial [Frankiaceae bacterium]|nr:hypothetical protein [Frankiaceae bacterium]
MSVRPPRRARPSRRAYPLARVAAAGLAAAGLVAGVVPAAGTASALGATDPVARALGVAARDVTYDRGADGLLTFLGTAAGRAIPAAAGVTASTAPEVAASRFLGEHANLFGRASTMPLRTSTLDGGGHAVRS